MCLTFEVLFCEIWYSGRGGGGGGCSSETKEPKLRNWLYFGQIIVKSTQFGQNWVFFFQKWCTHGWEIWQKIGIVRKSDFWGLAGTSTYHFGESNPPPRNQYFWSNQGYAVFILACRMMLCQASLRALLAVSWLRALWHCNCYGLITKQRRSWVELNSTVCDLPQWAKRLRLSICWQDPACRLVILSSKWLLCSCSKISKAKWRVAS